MRKALCVGINYYSIGELYGCVNDAKAVANTLKRNYDSTLNFETNVLLAEDEYSAINRADLKSAIEDLFAGDSEIALFYFSGHGYLETTGGYIVSSDSTTGDDGVSLRDILTYASNSKATNKIIILDSCFSGIAGTINQFEEFSLISEGTTILTACGRNQYATEENGHGLFTSLLVDALSGGATNLLGEVTPGSVYAYIDQSLGAFQQRPLFKTNIKNFVPLTKCKPPIALSELHLITELFKSSDYEFMLDPTYEFTEDECIEEHCSKFKILQHYNRLNLVVPVGEEHMYFAAMNSKSCKLTPLGKHYWNLVKNSRI